MSDQKFSRRRFLHAVTATSFGAVLAACGSTGGGAPAATTAPASQGATSAPAAEAATSAPAATTAPAAGATAAPAAGATAAPAATTGAAANLPAAPAPGPIDLQTIGGMDKLVAEAKKEGQLTTIALPRDWLNYGAVLDSFKNKYGLTINELDPNAGSGDEVNAIKANAGNSGPQAPDVIDVGFAFGPPAKQDGLLQPYKVSTWSTIPDDVKDADGFWYGDYYGVLSFMINSDVVKTPPQDWADLLKADYKGQVALTGDPRTSSQAIQSVYAAALANGGSLDNAQPGLEFFAKLNSAGNLVPLIATNATLASGETPIEITWDYLALGGRDSLNGNPPIEVVVPASAVFGGVYVQGISAYAPHPYAARLWMEHLYSDEVQLIWMAAYGTPIRINDLAKNNKIPAEIASKRPSADLYAKTVFPSVDQLDKAKQVITSGWDSTVKVNIQKQG
jgi:putative spermidine/putrescine transport system substrate-binding protein